MSFNKMGLKMLEEIQDKGLWEKRQLTLIEKTAKIAWIHSELSEVFETLRTQPTTSLKIPPHSDLAEELADVQILLLAFASSVGVDLDNAVEAKRQYNKAREYRHHKLF